MKDVEEPTRREERKFFAFSCASAEISAVSEPFDVFCASFSPDLRPISLKFGSSGFRFGCCEGHCSLFGSARAREDYSGREMQ